MIRRSLLAGSIALGLLASSASPASPESPAPPAPKPLGRMVDVEGHLMHINCAGEGSPAVILEAGAGGFSFDWALVQPEIAKSTRVCSYDRAGQAWSELGPQPRTIRQKVHELHALLGSAGVPGPYVLVGHSAGGYIVRQFQAAYPGEVAGMVLAECGHENSLFLINGRLVRMTELSKGRPVPEPRSDIKDGERTIPPDLAKRLESQQQMFGPPANDPPYDKLPPDIQKIRLWALGQLSHLMADENPFEGEEMAAMNEERGKRDHPLGDLPLIVLHRELGGYKPVPRMITPDQATQLDEERVRMNQDLVRLSGNSRHIIARHSTHDIHLDRPDLVIDAIRQVLEAARRHTSVRQDESVQ